MYRQWYQRRWKWLQRNPGGSYGEEYDPRLRVDADSVVVVDSAVAPQILRAAEGIERSFTALSRLVTVNPAVPVNRDWSESMARLTVLSKSLRDLAERLEGQRRSRTGAR